MCPTFIATSEEVMSTRGRANTIRAVLELRGGGDPLHSAELEAALGNCLSCKACTSECPSNVNMALLKAELQYARIRRDGLSLRERLLSSVDRLGRLGCAMPGIANAIIGSKTFRRLLARVAGLATDRPLPLYTRTRFDHWFAHRRNERPLTRGRVILWDDTFVRYHDPHIGMAAVKLLETAGFEVILPPGRQCCGRPAFSQGNLDEAMRLGRHNLALFSNDTDNAPILFLEPSCYSMFVEDYRELNLPDAARVATRCFLVGEFLDDLLRRAPDSLRFQPATEHIAIHVHCHAKALTNPAYTHRLVTRLTSSKVTYLDTGCCGMAGAFGLLGSKYELSLEVAKPLIEKIRGLPFGTVVVASGTSCRHQIEHLAPIRPKHIVEVLAEALK
jgi:Fe-S oxidoreductase